MLQGAVGRAAEGQMCRHAAVGASGTKSDRREADSKHGVRVGRLPIFRGAERPHSQRDFRFRPGRGAPGPEEP